MNIKLCSCGCGSIPNTGKIFVHGHNSRVNNPAQNENVGKKISEAKMGMVFTKEHRDKLSYAKGGNGSPFETKEIVIKNHHQCQCGCGKLIASNKKYAHGHNKPTRGSVFSIERRIKISDRMKNKWKSESYALMQKDARKVRPNKPESKILEMLEKMYPGEWRYTGDFSFMINGKNPDFVNCNGQKKIIELFGDYFHKDQNPQDRAKIFSPFGYETLVIWEHELSDLEKTERKIRDFANHRQDHQQVITPGM